MFGKKSKGQPNGSAPIQRVSKHEEYTMFKKSQPWGYHPAEVEARVNGLIELLQQANERNAILEQAVAEREATIAERDKELLRVHMQLASVELNDVSTPQAEHILDNFAKYNSSGAEEGAAQFPKPAIQQPPEPNAPAAPAAPITFSAHVADAPTFVPESSSKDKKPDVPDLVQVFSDGDEPVSQEMIEEAKAAMNMFIGDDNAGAQGASSAVIDPQTIADTQQRDSKQDEAKFDPNLVLEMPHDKNQNGDSGEDEICGFKIYS